MTLARCQQLVRGWSDARSPISPAYANAMPTTLSQVWRWDNVSPTRFKGTCTIYNYKYARETWFSLLCVIVVTIYSISRSRMALLIKRS